MTAYDPLSQVKLKLFFNVLQYATLGTNLIYIEIRPLGGTNIYTGYFNLTTAPSFMLDMEGQYGVMNLDFPYLLYTSLYNPSTGVYTAPPGIPGSLSLFTMVIVPIALAYTQEPEYVTSYYINVGTISGTQVFGFTMQVDFAVQAPIYPVNYVEGDVVIVERERQAEQNLDNELEMLMNQEDVAAEGDRRNIFEWTDPSAYVLADPLYFIKAAKNAVVDLMGPSYRGGSGPSDIYTNPALQGTAQGIHGSVKQNKTRPGDTWLPGVGYFQSERDKLEYLKRTADNGTHGGQQAGITAEQNEATFVGFLQDTNFVAQTGADLATAAIVYGLQAAILAGAIAIGSFGGAPGIIAGSVAGVAAGALLVPQANIQDLFDGQLVPDYSHQNIGSSISALNQDAIEQALREGISKKDWADIMDYWGTLKVMDYRPTQQQARSGQALFDLFKDQISRADYSTAFLKITESADNFQHLKGASGYKDAMRMFSAFDGNQQQMFAQEVNRFLLYYQGLPQKTLSPLVQNMLPKLMQQTIKGNFNYDVLNPLSSDSLVLNSAFEDYKKMSAAINVGQIPEGGADFYQIPFSKWEKFKNNKLVSKAGEILSNKKVQMTLKYLPAVIFVAKAVQKGASAWGQYQNDVNSKLLRNQSPYLNTVPNSQSENYQANKEQQASENKTQLVPYSYSATDNEEMSIDFSGSAQSVYDYFRRLVTVENQTQLVPYQQPDPISYSATDNEEMSIDFSGNAWFVYDYFRRLLTVENVLTNPQTQQEKKAQTDFDDVMDRNEQYSSSFVFSKARSSRKAQQWKQRQQKFGEIVLKQLQLQGKKRN